MGFGIAKVLLKRDVLDSLLEYAKANYPNESVVLLRGKVQDEKAWIEQLVFPPGAIHGESESSFNPYLLPFDASIIGMGHSHPTSDPHPSLQDLLHYYGRIALLVTYPYESVENVVAYDRDGRITPCEVY